MPPLRWALEATVCQDLTIVGVAEALAVRSSCRVALALVAGRNFVVDWAVAFASAARCEVAEAT